MVNFKFSDLKPVNKLNFYLGFLVSAFVNGASWKLERITELTTQEKRRIIIRNMSTYDELFSRQEKHLNANS